MKKTLLAAAVLISIASATIALSSNPYLSEGFSVSVPPYPDSAQEARLVLAAQAMVPERITGIVRQNKDIIEDFWVVAGRDSKSCLNANVFAGMAIHELMSDTLFGQKDRFDRIRPHRQLPDIKPAVEVPWHAAYPSGHATQGRMLARIFGAWYPEKAQDFLTLGDQIAMNRVVGGLHYPSDSVAGQLVADKLFEDFMKSPEFSEAMKSPCMAEHGVKGPAMISFMKRLPFKIRSDIHFEWFKAKKWYRETFGG